jgi:hypothetical protein
MCASSCQRETKVQEPRVGSVSFAISDALQPALIYYSCRFVYFALSFLSVNKAIRRQAASDEMDSSKQLLFICPAEVFISTLKRLLTFKYTYTFIKQP